MGSGLLASSHREAPLIADDPLADNVDVYAFRSPDMDSMVTLIATYIPMQLPHGGPNWYHFGEDIRYEIHVDNDTDSSGDDIIFRFTFTRVNEDPETFFNIRLGNENLKTTYTLEVITNDDEIDMLIEDGVVPAPNIGPRSIQNATVGLGQDSYESYSNSAIDTLDNGMMVFAGPVDDPFFVDLGGIFDLGDTPRQDGDPIDGLACFNTNALVLNVPIKLLLNGGLDGDAIDDISDDDAPDGPVNILDPDYVIGVWASASRPKVRVFQNVDVNEPGDATGYQTTDNEYIQVSRLGMPLTNEAIIPVGMKDYWNALNPYQELNDTLLDQYFYNPELALYMDTAEFADAVPAFAPLRIQENSLGMFDFTNGADGLFGLKGDDALDGTALSEEAFGGLLLPSAGKPRSVGPVADLSYRGTKPTSLPTRYWQGRRSPGGRTALHQ